MPNQKLPSGQPGFSVSVTTPETPVAPNNYIAKQLEELTNKKDIQELRKHAITHGYSAEGQTIKLIDAKLAEHGGK